MFRGWFSQPFMRIAFHCILLIRRITRLDCLIRDPKDLKVAIGPSICQDCYEVSEDVIEEFEKVFDKKYRNKLFYRKENGKYQLNLWMANKIIFLEAGIPEENISMPNLCTCCNPEFLFSHRASHGKRGNLGAFLGIRS